MWPIINTPIEDITQYSHRATCGCWYSISAWTIGVKPDYTPTTELTIAVSPYRMQRCFRHMKIPNVVIAESIFDELSTRLSTGVENFSAVKKLSSYPLT